MNLRIGSWVICAALVAVVAGMMLHIVPASAEYGRESLVDGKKTSPPLLERSPGEPNRPAQGASQSTPELKPLELDVNSISPPVRPAWESVVEYRRKASPTLPLKAEVFSSLSYCVNTKKASEIVRLKQSSGEGTEVEIKALREAAESNARHCSRLSDSDFAIRSDLVNEQASQGDIPSALLFYAVGPGGSWLDSEARLNSKELDAWNSKAVKYLEQAARRGSIEANGTLFSHYSVATGPGEKPRDAIRAYAHGLLWAEAVVKNNPSIESAVRQRLDDFGRSLSEDEKTQARALIRR